MSLWCLGRLLSYQTYLIQTTHPSHTAQKRLSTVVGSLWVVIVASMKPVFARYSLAFSSIPALVFTALRKAV